MNSTEAKASKPGDYGKVSQADEARRAEVEAANQRDFEAQAQARQAQGNLPQAHGAAGAAPNSYESTSAASGGDPDVLNAALGSADYRGLPVSAGRAAEYKLSSFAPQGNDVEMHSINEPAYDETTLVETPAERAARVMEEARSPAQNAIRDARAEAITQNLGRPQAEALERTKLGELAQHQANESPQERAARETREAANRQFTQKFETPEQTRDRVAAEAKFKDVLRAETPAQRQARETRQKRRANAAIAAGLLVEVGFPVAAGAICAWVFSPRTLIANPISLTGLEPGPVPVPVTNSVASSDGATPTIILGATTTGGNWTVDASNTIQFAPFSGQDPTKFPTTATASYQAQITPFGVQQLSNSAAISLSFDVPVAAPITKQNQPRGAVQLMDFSGSKYTVTVDTGTNGSFTAANNVISFAATGTDFTKPATANYTLTYGAAKSSSTITLDFAPATQTGTTPNPAAFVRSNLPHVMGTFEVRTAAEIQANLTVQLVNPPSALTVDGNNQVLFNPAGFDFTKPATCSFQLFSATTGKSAMTAMITLNFAVYTEPMDATATGNYSDTISSPRLSTTGTVQVVGGNGMVYVQPGVGTWTATGSAITFKADAALPANGTPPPQVGFFVQFDASTKSGMHTLTILFNKPVTSDLVLDQLPMNQPCTFLVAASAAAAMGTGNQIVKTSILLLGVATDPKIGPAGEVEQPSNSKDLTTGYPLRPNHQGHWVVDDGMGVVTFTPDATFTASPSPVTYTIADDHGNVSDPKVLIALYGPDAKLTPDVVVDDNVFWDGFEMEVIYRNPPVFIFPTGEMALLTLLNAYVSAFFMAVPPLLPSMPADPFTTAQYDARYAQYSTAPGPTPMSLYTSCEDISDSTIGNTTGTPYLARYWRLKVMAHLLNKTLTGNY